MENKADLSLGMLQVLRWYMQFSVRMILPKAARHTDPGKSMFTKNSPVNRGK